MLNRNKTKFLFRKERIPLAKGIDSCCGRNSPLFNSIHHCFLRLKNDAGYCTVYIKSVLLRNYMF